ncbi:PiggyBac transposable element-derived protein 4 [Merluccius polli]|uniref:PiggyBac transposable element-derived protein 4 n=1 Tax=Merluccius polli TaxID=89951 RepID=A0AA47NUX5_MERPO|nr:PiggyBac transposable element-derived protein 4 [Merluccius polli]
MFEDEDSDDDNKEFKGFESDWKTENYHHNQRSAFNRKPGVKVDLPADATPLQAFNQIFTEELWAHLVSETNNYSDQTHQTPSRAKMARWSRVTVPEMKTFIGLCMGMGLMVLPVRRDYWRQSKHLFRTQFPRNMSRDRFVAIWRYLHLQNNQAADVNRGDKLWKMRWFLNYITARFQALYEVDGNVSVDESMIKFKGHLAFRQYLPMKPTKWGVKVWVMSESSTGYVTNFQIYAGREGSTEKGLAHHVVMDLARPYYGSHLSVYMDNFYTGVSLFEEMKSHGLYACGTVRANRAGLPKNERLTKKASMGKHKFRVAQKGELTFCIWQDTKTVMVLSNHHNPTQTGTVNRRRDGANHVQVVVPTSLADYQKYMKGVDLLDQMVGYYGFQHRSKKWWRRVFFFFLAVSCYNAYIAARSVGGTAFRNKYRGYKNWLEDLAEQLITPLTTRAVPATPPPPPSSLSASPSPPPTPSSSAGSRGHTPLPQHDCGKVYDKRKQCRECQLVPDNEKVGGPTVYGCKQCNLPLHIECFGKHYRRYM